MGNEIRKCLYEKNLSVNWLADALGCDQSNLNKKLQKPKVDPDLVCKISQLLGVNLFDCYSKHLADE